MIEGIHKINPSAVHYVFVPCRDKSLFGRNSISKDAIKIVYFYVPSWLKFFPIIKVFFAFLKVIVFFRKESLDVSKFKGVAYTFWSDGAITFLVRLFYKCPYIVCVRNTDIQVFFKYGYHLRPLMKLIFNFSIKVVCPSRVISESVLSRRWLCSSESKVCVIPNPLPLWWAENSVSSVNSRLDGGYIYGVFVGSFDKNKNLTGVVEAISHARERYPSLQLMCVGGEEEEMFSLLGEGDIPDYLKVMGRIDDKNHLLKIYRRSAFLIVPSYQETFGMVYIEAISQGCSVIYSEGQAVDGMLPKGKFSFAVLPGNTENMSMAICSAIEMRETVSVADFLDVIALFDMNQVCKAYLNIFEGLK
ncbi:glycosyltransferase family 4 protein [Alloalcanivorax xenomutans]|uniref:glycosyltransferase family 4 protein n=1 Tax=Alloalcanivorax xenomutans TaxID=1094342 RepID=UPI003A80C4C4